MEGNLLLVALLLAIASPMKGQDWFGLHADNYAGVYNLGYQPADIVDSKYKVDINLIGVGLNFSNNYIGVRSSALLKDTLFKDPNVQRNYLVERLDGADKMAYLKTQAFLPAVSFGFGKNALAFSANAHLAANLNGVSEELAHIAYTENRYPDYWDRRYQNNHLSLQAMAWMDYGVTYGREVFSKGHHYLKGAATLKLLQGFGAAHLYAENLEVSFKNNDTMSIVDSDIAYGHSDNFEIGLGSFNYKPNYTYGVGFDFGFVYEFRKKRLHHNYGMGNSDQKSPNKYLFKLGLSVIDIGALPFQKGGQSRSFYANKADFSISDLYVRSLDELDSLLVTDFVAKNDSGAVFTMNLPTRINLMGDYNMGKGFFVNANLTIAPFFKTDADKISSLTHFSITPRYERKWFMLGMPISYDAMGNWGLGIALRMGPLVLGSRDITPLLGKEVAYSTNAYVGLRIPIFEREKSAYRPKNRRFKAPKHKNHHSEGCFQNRF